MTTTDEITKDQQIQNQLETIQSLNRKIESLEAELQKCLDLEGDSDTTRGKRWTKDDSLTAEQKEAIVAKLEHVLRGTFMESGTDEEVHKTLDAWEDFNIFLHHDDSIDHMRTDKDFKWGVQMVVNAVSRLDRLVEYRQGMRASIAAELAHMFIGEIALGDTSDQRAVTKLLEVFNHLRGRAKYYNFDEEKFTRLDIDLETIQRCQAVARTTFLQYKMLK